MMVFKKKNKKTTKELKKKNSWYFEKLKNHPKIFRVKLTILQKTRKLPKKFFFNLW